jgi:predicted NAD/FAD-binding protein
MESPVLARKRICVIGGGISGLACAFALCDANDVTLLERHGTLGSACALQFKQWKDVCSIPPSVLHPQWTLMP